MKVDLITLFGLVLNSTGWAVLWALLERKEMQDLAAQLRDAIKPDWSENAPESEYVAKKLKPFSGQLFSIWMFLLHFLNVAFLATIVVVLFVGPEEIFTSAQGEQPEPLALWQLCLSWVWFGLNLLAYMARGVGPTVNFFMLWQQAKAWLRIHATSHSGRTT
ncbi:MAG: hypothetical protein HYX75_14095 [Acidobacteria bacterium]|nr:hypothetical protein [Acidobacteriota bacterium]